MRAIFLLNILVSGVFVLTSCNTTSTIESRSITLQQQWALNPGDKVAGNIVAGGLGDISLYLESQKIKAPFDGDLELSESDECVLYSTPEIPAYLFRLCGLNKVSYGSIRAGKIIGRGQYLSFATLRRQPDGTWVIVEPARTVLEKALES